MVKKGRKPGDWISISLQRERIPRDLPTSRGLSNIPNVRDHGSAAYRRLKARTKVFHWRKPPEGDNDA